LARAYRDQLGLTELYVADLDAIAGQPPARSIYAELAGLGLKVFVDAGIRDLKSLHALTSAPIEAFIIGLETVAGPGALSEILMGLGPSRTMFSLDLKDRQPLGNLSAWETPTAMGIARQAIRLGVTRMILIDLAQVGMGRGTGTEELARQILTLKPDLELLAGGGVRSLEDLQVMQKRGVSGVLLATVLHDGRVGRSAIRALQE
jgi:phosphoribosylformimino-5-aminoimidazole carboxamide ribotide isomerase